MKRVAAAVGIALLAGCAPQGDVSTGGDPTNGGVQALTAAQLRGKNTWFKSTFGGEHFFSQILPGAPFNLPIGLDLVLTTPRSQRFTQWGVVNDPDCTDGDASTGGLDKCPDPNASGVVGVRKFVQADGSVLVGVACAGCHAGLDPQNPPADPNHPTWANIHATIGNQFIQIGKIFGAHLPAGDPRALVFSTWAPGTVDTTAIESDGINNPGIITQFFNLNNRPYFNLHQNGAAITVHRGGQGGEDDTGCENAALRVYFNIGMCAAQCMVPHLANGPGGTQTPIDLTQCAQVCPDLVAAQAAVGDMCNFMATTTPPSLQSAPGGRDLIDSSKIVRGAQVFAANCASCHSSVNAIKNNVFSDDLLHPQSQIGTNACRSMTTNWQTGHIWAAFSSDEQRAGTFGQPGAYRDVPLLGIWATAPFFHNNRLGPYNASTTVAGRVANFTAAMNQLLTPSSQRTPIVDVVPGTSIPIRAAIHDLCTDYVENFGHDFGTNLSAADKAALIEAMKLL